MPDPYPDLSRSHGNTPLVRLKRIVPAGAAVYAKIEARNPCFSVKDRTGASMIDDAERGGRLRPGGEIVEPTSGNTGIALAVVAAARGYRLTLTMPETMSVERRKVLAFLGATLILTPGNEGMAGAIRRAEELVASDPERYFLPQQFKNPANPAVHERDTGPEIWRDLSGRVDALVCGVGTGGTLSGAARFLKARAREAGRVMTAVAVEPSESPVIAQRLAGLPLTPAPHPIQGIGAGFIPDTLDLSVVDRVEGVDGAEAMDWSRRLAREEGILSGISSGAAMAAAARLASEPAYADRAIVVVLPDAGERYLSTALFS